MSVAGASPSAGVLLQSDGYRSDHLVASSWCKAGATFSPIRSIARMSVACGNDVTFIWNVMREMPPSASLWRWILSTTSSGLPITNAPFGPRCASKAARVTGGHLSRRMLEHYSHIGIDPKRQALDALDAARRSTAHDGDGTGDGANQTEIPAVVEVSNDLTS
jgi:hypothetical protein